MSGDRGLLDVLADRDVPFPNSWSTNPGRRPADVNSSFVRRSPCLPGSAEFAAVDQLVQATWKQDFVGQGADALGLTHKSIVVTKVARIEHGEQFKKYTECRRNFCKALRDGVTFPSVKDSDNGLDVETSAFEMSALDWWDREGHVKHYPLPSINEVLLFHGTKPDDYEAIIREGFDTRLNQRSIFGNGTYLTESSTKADQYADAIDARQLTGEKYMIVTRVILGHPYVCTKPHPFRRPPCVEPNCDRMNMCAATHKKSHSVIGVSWSDGQCLLFREFVVYDSSQCYPLYLVTYNRITTEWFKSAKVTKKEQNILALKDFNLFKSQVSSARTMSKSPSSLLRGQMSESILPLTEQQHTMCSHSIDSVFNQKTPRDWEHVEDDFTSLGGELSHWASDNSLLVTRGAIPVGETWRIRGKIHTLLDQFVESLRQCDNYRDIFPTDAWRFCSSVVEFKITNVNDKGQDMPMHVPVKREFLKPVIINIRHTASEHSRRHLRVFCVQDNNLIQEIKASKIDNPNCSVPSFVEKTYLTLKTTHFSYYFVCICNEQVVNVNMLSINAIVYGRIYEEADGECRYKAEIDCVFEFLSEESVSRLPEFWQKHVKVEEKTQKLHRELTFPPEYLNSSAEMHVTLTLSTPGWVINTKMCNREKIFKFADIYQRTARMHVHMQSKYIEKYFALTGGQDSVSAAIDVTLQLNEQNQSSRLEPLGFNLKIKEKQDPPRFTSSADSGSLAAVGGVNNDRENTALSKQNLLDIARSIAPDDILPLALELNYDRSEVRQFQRHHPLDTRRSTMGMLDRWCDEKMGDEQMALEDVIAMLSQKLIAVKCVDAAFKLQGIAGRAIDSRDLMALAKAIPPDNYLSLGLGLHLIHAELKCIKVDNPSDSLSAMFCMLDLWCKTALTDGLPLDRMVHTLSEALHAECLTNVAQMLDGYADNRRLRVAV